MPLPGLALQAQKDAIEKRCKQDARHPLAAGDGIFFRRKNVSGPYEIYIDESGTFEAFKEFDESEPIRLIGGIVVPGELKQREESLRNGLMSICERYFKISRTIMDIHFSDKSKLKDPDTMWKMRKEVIHFLINKMPEAKLFFIYDLETLEENADPPGAQRYRYMLLKLLNAILFYHPMFERNALFDVKLASRRVPYPIGYDRALANQGYLKLKDLKGETWFTAITEADIQSVISQLSKSLRFSTERNATFKIQPYGKWDNPFMVMADAVCNTVLNIFRETKPDKLSGALDKSFSDLRRIFFYCSMDFDFPAGTLDYYYNHKPGEFIRRALKNGIETESDALVLMPAIQKAAQEIGKTSLPGEVNDILVLADEILEAKLFYKTKMVNVLINYAKGRLDQIEQDEEDAAWAPVIYLYHDVAMRYFNHHGNVVQSAIHRDEGDRIFKKFLGTTTDKIREYHRFVNRASVIDTNEFAFKRAINRLEPVVRAEESISKALVAPGTDIGTIKSETLGRIYGSIAQNHAFNDEHSPARDFFVKAGQQLGMNQAMQVSFRAHLWLEMKDLDAYESEIKNLFPIAPGEPYNGFCFMFPQALDDLPGSAFNLHLLLKGLIIFGNDQDKKNIVPILFDAINAQYLNRSREKHPWELIFICLGRLLDEIGKTEAANKCWDAAINFNQNPDNLTFIMLAHSARAWKALSLICTKRVVSEVDSLLKDIAVEFETFRTNGNAPGILDPSGNGEGWFDAVGIKILDRKMPMATSHIQALLEEFIGRFTFNYW